MTRIFAIKAAIKAGRAVYNAWVQYRTAKRLARYEHQAQVLRAKLIATAAGDPEPEGN